MNQKREVSKQLRLLTSLIILKLYDLESVTY